MHGAQYPCVERVPYILKRVEIRRLGWPGQDPEVIIGQEFLVFLGCVLWVIVMLEYPSGPSKCGIVQFLHLWPALMAEYSVVSLTVHNSLYPLEDPHAGRVKTSYSATTMLDSRRGTLIFEFLQRTSSNISVTAAWKEREETLI